MRYTGLRKRVELLERLAPQGQVIRIEGGLPEGADEPTPSLPRPPNKPQFALPRQW
jgi:hypothetical protein